MIAVLGAKPEIILGVQNADDIVHSFTTDRVIRMAAFMDQLLPLLHRVFQPQKIYIGSVDADFINGQIIELKYVLNHIFFFIVDRAFFAAGIYHHPDFFLRHLIVVLIRIDPQKAQDTVCRCSQQPHKRCKHFRSTAYKTGNPERNLLSLLHCNPFRHQFAKDQGDIR